jgi:ceramide glucosyltransferase
MAIGREAFRFLFSLPIDVIAVFSILFSIIAAILAPLAFKRCGQLELGALSPVTLLKPLKGLESELYENLKSFCSLDYPSIQILFTVANPEDPALNVVKRLQNEFPNIDIDTIISKDIRIGSNPKINNIAAAAPYIKHDLILISDSDVLVRRDFLKRMAAPLKDPKIGLVTSFYQGAIRKALWPRLEAISINAYFLPQAAIASFFGMRFAMGAAILVRREAFEKAGGFVHIAQYLADDFVLGESIRKAGFEIAAADTLPECVTEAPNFKAYLRHQIRWAHTIRVCRPAGYFGLIMLQGFSLLTLKILFFGFDPLSLGLMALILLSKALTQERLAQVSGEASDSWALFLLPLSEWVHFASWVVGWRAKNVFWRGERYAFSQNAPVGALILKQEAAADA